MAWRSILSALVIVLGVFVSLQAQTVTAIIERDVRVFTVVAALNAGGFDVELAPQYHPVRQQVRDRLSALDPDLTNRLREFYQEHRAGEPDDLQLPKYLSLALNLTDPPMMALAHPPDLVPPEAVELIGFLPLLQEFYEAARVTQLWAILGPDYDRVLEDLVPELRETIIRSDAHLRVPLGGSGGRQLVIYVELAAPVNSVNVRNYPDNLYIVLGPPTTPPTDEVRHAYLHLLLDRVVADSRDEFVEVADLGQLIVGVEGVAEEYAADFEILVAESLIRAAELSIDAVSGIEAESRLDAAYRRGLLLAPHFYDELQRFEELEVGIREQFPVMIQSIETDLEQDRFEERFHSILPPIQETRRAEVPVVPSPVPELLRQAQEAFNAGDDETARSFFARVLEEYEANNGLALYGLALIASREENSAAAREYFVRTIESNTAEASMRVWSHIYLGRIHDIECERQEALRQYQRALEIGDDTRGALEVAREGLSAPFGGGCDLP